MRARPAAALGLVLGKDAAGYCLTRDGALAKLGVIDLAGIAPHHRPAEVVGVVRALRAESPAWAAGLQDHPQAVPTNGRQQARYLELAKFHGIVTGPARSAGRG